MDRKELLNTFMVELKRGTLSMMVLSQLRKQEYGYSLLQKLIDKGMNIEANTLYPLLRRMESYGVLDCSWDTSESRPRKYYVLNSYGRDILGELEKEWYEMQEQMNLFLGGQ